MTLYESIVLFAQRHDGVFNSFLARPLFVEAGVLIGEPKRVSAALHGELSRSDEFEETGKRGSWRYMPIKRHSDPPPSPQTSFAQTAA